MNVNINLSSEAMKISSVQHSVITLATSPLEILEIIIRSLDFEALVGLAATNWYFRSITRYFTNILSPTKKIIMSAENFMKWCQYSVDQVACSIIDRPLKLNNITIKGNYDIISRLIPKLCGASYIIENYSKELFNDVIKATTKYMVSYPDHSIVINGNNTSRIQVIDYRYGILELFSGSGIDEADYKHIPRKDTDILYELFLASKMIDTCTITEIMVILPQIYDLSPIILKTKGLTPMLLCDLLPRINQRIMINRISIVGLDDIDMLILIIEGGTNVSFASIEYIICTDDDVKYQMDKLIKLLPGIKIYITNVDYDKIDDSNEHIAREFITENGWEDTMIVVKQ